ncbi:glycosyl hydrolase 108 family protein [Sphingomonas asaccharolytica]|uniref:glycosyl hydrolase 108 family protein n=1 Tax=Sphingomonas asaccharolytica TaxID=40681 RepID=UPI000834A148|nr:glycosyl hydrolase 108 family protein [Sphingomonas asaccharolytica]
MTEGVDNFAEGYAAARAGWASKGAIAAAVAVILAGVYAVEGGYVNDARDPGGATNYGVTEQVARDYGYRGDMRRFPQHCDGPAAICADAVYVRSYIAAPGYMPLVEIEPAVAGELIDTAVNMGPRRPNRWYRLAMNALGGARLPDSAASLGPVDVAAYRMLRAKLGVIPACTATLDALDVRQAAEYRRLAADNPKLRAFLKGWIRNRIGNVDRRSCGKGDG